MYPKIALAGGGGLFAGWMFLACHAWLAVVHEVTASAWTLGSFALQQAVLWTFYALIDERLKPRWAQFLWACIATLYATLTVFDGLLMRMTSLPLREILPMLLASQHVIEGLREIGLRPVRVVVLFLLLVAAALSGGFARLVIGRMTRHWRFAPRSQQPLPRVTGRLFVAMVALFVVEQTLARDQPDYLLRAFQLPAYMQLYSTSSRSVEVPIPPPVPHSRRAQWLKQIVPARNPKHVLYVLLESFRADAVTPEVAPAMTELAREGTQYENALAEATYTPLSWSVLLFDEAAHDNLFGRHPGRPEPLGSWLLSVMRKAGYEPHVYVSTNLTYAKTRDRVLGPEPRTLDFFQAASDQGEDPADKNTNDRVAVDHTVQFIEQHSWDERPQFLLLQLDSTHYTYPFPEDQAVFTPFSENLELPRPIETEDQARLLHNRYRNAAHYVDAQLERVFEALKREGVYDDMAIVLTADHGEGLQPGFQGHAAVFDATRHVPLVLKLPGRAPSKSSQLVSHRDILPTLAEYLQIDMPAGSTRGRRIGRDPEQAVLTLAPSGRFGQVITPERVVDVRLLYEPLAVTVTPANETSGQNEAQWLPLLKTFVQGR